MKWSFKNQKSLKNIENAFLVFIYLCIYPLWVYYQNLNVKTFLSSKIQNVSSPYDMD